MSAVTRVSCAENGRTSLLLDIVKEDMRFPLIICSHGRLVIAPEDWFDGIGSLDPLSALLRINVSDRGQAGLAWFIDADGLFHTLTWQALEPATLLQFLRLSKRVERYAIAAPRVISFGELSGLVANLTEAFNEAPLSAGFRKLVAKGPPEETVSTGHIRKYLGA